MILIILPVRNEEKTIQETMNSIVMWAGVNPAEILFIDDGSTDATFQFIKSNPKVKVYKNVFDRGKGSALKAGCVYAEFNYKLSDTDKVVFLDGDNQIDPAEIKTMLNIMDLYNADVVIGNKRHLYSYTHYGFLRRIVSNGYNLMVRCLFGFDYRDTQCGLKIFTKKSLDEVLYKVNTKRYAFDVELLVAMRQMGLRIADAPVKVRKAKNVGAINMKNVLQTFIDTIIIKYHQLRGQYK